MASTAQLARELARLWNEEVWNRRNLAAIDELTSEDFVSHEPTGEDVYGPEGARASVERLLRAFPDTQVRLNIVMAEDDLVTAHFTASGTHHGPLMGIEATGRDVEVDGITIRRVRDGRFVEEWGVVDFLSMLQQLGAIEAPAQGRRAVLAPRHRTTRG